MKGLEYYVLMLGEVPYDYCFVSEKDALEEAYKMGIVNAYIYKVTVAT